MIWLTWRQHRKQALFAVLGLAVLAAVLIPTGRQMYDAFEDTGLRDCLDTIGRAELVELSAIRTCEDARSAFANRYGDLHVLLAALLLFLPVLAGMFWGATLVAREVEHGTHRLVWTQGVTRLRWLLVKGGLVAAGATIAAIAFAVLMWWWLTPLAAANGGRFNPGFFDVSGLAPVGYTLFAIALGVFAGAVSRKVLPAMAITLVGFVAARIAVGLGGRPRFQEPVALQYPVETDLVPNEFRGDWVQSIGIYDESGNLLDRDASALCEAPPDGPPCATDYNVTTLQPGDRFWLFQYLEFGILVGLSVLLVLLAIWQVRRRIS